MNRMYRYCIVAAAILGNSCMVGPKFRAPVVETPPQYIGTANAATADLCWWQLFNDTTLVRLISTAVENNRSVGMAFSRVEQARLALKATRANLWPSLQYGIDAQYGTESFIGTKSDKPIQSYIIKPSITWELDLFGKIRRMSEADRAQLLASDQAAQGVLVALVADVASGYFSLLEYEALIQTAQGTALSRQETFQLMQQSYAIGTINELQLRQAEVTYASANSMVSTYERARQQALHSLSVLLGENPSAVIGIHTPLSGFAVPAEIPAGLPSDLLARRPDMVEAYYQVMAANAQIGVAQAMRFPSIALTGNGGLFNEDFRKLFSAQSWMWSAAGSISGPIFNFEANKRKVQIMREKHKEAVLNYEQCFLQALQEVEDALSAINTYHAQIAAMQTVVQAANQANQIAEAQYTGGQVSFLNVLDTQRTLLEAQTNYAQTLSATMSSYTDLYKALGGGIVAPTKQAEVK